MLQVKVAIHLLVRKIVIEFDRKILWYDTPVCLNIPVDTSHNVVVLINDFQLIIFSNAYFRETIYWKSYKRHSTQIRQFSYFSKIVTYPICFHVQLGMHRVTSLCLLCHFFLSCTKKQQNPRKMNIQVFEYQNTRIKES